MCCRPIHASSDSSACSASSAGSALGLVAVAATHVMLVAAVNEWRVRDFGRLNYAETMRVVVPGVTLAVLADFRRSSPGFC